MTSMLPETPDTETSLLVARYSDRPTPTVSRECPFCKMLNAFSADGSRSECQHYRALLKPDGVWLMRFGR